MTWLAIILGCRNCKKNGRVSHGIHSSRFCTCSNSEHAVKTKDESQEIIEFDG